MFEDQERPPILSRPSRMRTFNPVTNQNSLSFIFIHTSQCGISSSSKARISSTNDNNIKYSRRIRLQVCWRLDLADCWYTSTNTFRFGPYITVTRCHCCWFTEVDKILIEAANGRHSIYFVRLWLGRFLSLQQIVEVRPGSKIQKHSVHTHCQKSNSRFHYPMRLEPLIQSQGPANWADKVKHRLDQALSAFLDLNS